MTSLAQADARAVATVLDPGPRTTFQDMGRPGHAHLGVPPSGAVDRGAAMLANRLVGNPEGAPVLETTLRGPTIELLRPANFALTGAEVDAELSGRPVAMHAPFRAPAGTVLRVGEARSGLRTYLAVRGGFHAPPVLGSASSDALTGLGPAPLAAGDRLLVGALALDPPAVDIAPVAVRGDGPAMLEVTLGPRLDRFAPDARTTLLSATFRVSGQVDRVGVRLLGAALPHRTTDELRSEGLVAGAIQVPPSGAPILLLADHPTTGGYPVIAVVLERSLDRAAQLRPGEAVRFASASGSPPVARVDRLV